MSVHIVAATLRDLSYVASRLRPEDEREAACQFEQFSPALLATVSLKDHAYVVEVDGNPEAAFGACSTAHRGLWVAWSWGSVRMWRAVPLITQFVRAVMIPDIIAQGCWRCEARAMAENTGAHRWLKRMGATERADLPGWGKNGEEFTLFDWTRKDIERAQDRAVSRPLREPAGAARAHC